MLQNKNTFAGNQISSVYNKYPSNQHYSLNSNPSYGRAIMNNNPLNRPQSQFNYPNNPIYPSNPIVSKSFQPSMNIPPPINNQNSNFKGLSVKEKQQLIQTNKTKVGLYKEGDEILDDLELYNLIATNDILKISRGQKKLFMSDFSKDFAEFKQKLNKKIAKIGDRMMDSVKLMGKEFNSLKESLNDNLKRKSKSKLANSLPEKLNDLYKQIENIDNSELNVTRNNDKIEGLLQYLNPPKLEANSEEPEEYLMNIQRRANIILRRKEIEKFIEELEEERDELEKEKDKLEEDYDIQDEEVKITKNKYLEFVEKNVMEKKLFDNERKRYKIDYAEWERKNEKIRNINEKKIKINDAHRMNQEMLRMYNNRNYYQPREEYEESESEEEDEYDEENEEKEKKEYDNNEEDKKNENKKRENNKTNSNNNQTIQNSQNEVKSKKNQDKSNKSGSSVPTLKKSKENSAEK